MQTVITTTGVGLTGVVFSWSDVVVAQPVVLQERLHGVGGAADIAGVHGLGVVQLLLAAAGLVAVGVFPPLGGPPLQQHVLKVGLFGGGNCRPFGSSRAAAASGARRSASLGRLRQPVGRPVLTAAAAVAGDAGAVEDAVLVPQVALQQRQRVNGLPAEAAGELLAVRGDVTLQLHLRSERLAAEDALPGFKPCGTTSALHLELACPGSGARTRLTCSEAAGEAGSLGQVVELDVQLQIRLLPEVPGAGGAAKQLLLVAVLHGEMHLRWEESHR